MSNNVIILLILLGFTIFLWFFKYFLANNDLPTQRKTYKRPEPTHTYNQELVEKPLACSKHHTRLIGHGSFNTNHVNCRMHPSCYKNGKIVNADKIIGVIGKEIGLKNNTINHVFELYNIKGNFLRDGDFDIIKIYNNQKIEDYDKLLTKITSIYYNQIRRLKPINEVIIILYGKVPLSKNTIRYLKDKYLSVKYY